MKNLMMMFFMFFCAYTHAQEMVMLQGAEPGDDRSKVVNSRKSFEFLAFSQDEEMTGMKDKLVESHFLGDEIARKVYLFKEMYGYLEPVAPGNSATKTIFRKPVISNSVKRIERYLKKQVKTGEIPVETARSEYNKVLDVALNIININTDNFEKRLTSASDAAELLNVYIQEVNLNFVN
jgi:hypothetical protein